MALDLIGMLVASAGASVGWWLMHRRRAPGSGLRELESSLDADASIVFSVATHAMTSRGHSALWPIHVLYGLLQDETFTAAIRQLEGDPDASESRVLAELDQRDASTHDPEGMRDAGQLLSMAYGIAHANDRKISIRDLYARLARHDVAKLLGVDPHALLFHLAHQLPPPPVDLPGRTDVHVVLRNDDFTTQEFVVWILREVFALSDDDAHARMIETHTQGKSIVGRYKLAVARDKLVTVRARAREQCFPLWIGLEDC